MRACKGEAPGTLSVPNRATLDKPQDLIEAKNTHSDACCMRSPSTRGRGWWRVRTRSIGSWARARGRRRPGSSHVV